MLNEDTGKIAELAEEAHRASELMLAKSRADSSEMAGLARELEGSEAPTAALLLRLVATAEDRMSDLAIAMAKATGSPLAEAKPAARRTPLGMSLLAVMRGGREIVGTGAPGSEVSKLRTLWRSVDQMNTSDRTVEALARIDAGIRRLDGGRALPSQWMADTERLVAKLNGKEAEMTKKEDTPMGVLDAAERDAFGHLTDEAGTLAKMRRAAAPADVAKAGSATNRLEGLAKARATSDGIGYYDAYDLVAGENPELLAQAVTE